MTAKSVDTINPAHTAALQRWIERRQFNHLEDARGQLIERNNLAYLLAFLEANDDLFDHTFRRSITKIFDDQTHSVGDLRKNVEDAANVLRKEERRLTFGGGIPPVGDERLPAFVAVERALATAPSPHHRHAVRVSWDRSLDVNSPAVDALASAVAVFRAGVTDHVARGADADQFVAQFTVAAISATRSAFSTEDSPAVGSVVAAAETAMEEAPARMLELASRTHEPMLDVDQVLDSLRRRIRATTGAEVVSVRAEDRWELEFSVSAGNSAPGVTACVVVWPLPDRSQEMPLPHYAATPSLAAAGVPVAHIALRCHMQPSGQLVMHLRDLRATLHELGHAIHHALTASRGLLKHGLESAGETEIDLLSLWLEWSVFDSEWRSCVIAREGESPEMGLEEWQNLLRLETLKELPLRALVMALDRTWAAEGTTVTYADVWRRVTRSEPADHPSVYLETLHRLTWPIPMTRPGTEYGLFWAMTEVAATWSERNRTGSSDGTPPSQWYDRILGAIPQVIPNPNVLTRFLQIARDAPDTDFLSTANDGVSMSTTRDYPSDYIAAMLPTREPGLTEVLRDALVDQQLPPIHVDDNAARVLQCLTLMSRPRLVIEIGTLFGYSTIHLARGLGRRGRLISYEVDERAAQIARDNVRRFGLDDRVDISTEDAAIAITKISAGTADLVFIDGAKTEYVKYVKAVFPVLAPGGALIIDDAFAGGTYAVHEGGDDANAGAAIRQVVRALARSEQVTVSFLGTENGMLLAVKQGADNE